MFKVMPDLQIFLVRSDICNHVTSIQRYISESLLRVLCTKLLKALHERDDHFYMCIIDIHCHRLVGIWANVLKLGFGLVNFKDKSFGLAVQNFK